MQTIQRVQQKARIILNSEDAIKTVNNYHTIPVRDPPINFDGGTSAIISTTLSEIHFQDHKFITGEAITYTQGTTAIGGLTTATIYYAIVLNANVFKIATSAALAGTATSTPLTSAGTGVQTFSRTITFSGADATVVSVDNNTLTLNAHGLNNGDYVQYNNGGGTSITAVNLTTALFYWVYVQDVNTIKLCPTQQDAIGDIATATYIDFTALGVGTTHTIVKKVSFDSGASLIVDTVNEQLNIPAHGLNNGDTVQYQVGDSATAIAGLTDNEIYVVQVVDDDSIKLQNSTTLGAINITGVGSGNNHSITRIVQTPVPVCTNYRFKLPIAPLDLHSKCRMAVQSFDYAKNYATFNCKSIGAVYLKNIMPIDIYSTQGYQNGTFLIPVNFQSSFSYENNDILYTSIALPNNMTQLLQNGLDIFVDSKKRNQNNQDIKGCIDDDRFSLTLVIYEIDDEEFISDKMNKNAVGVSNVRLM